MQPSEILQSMMPAETLPLGLGCSRLGSVNGPSVSEATILLNTALERGFRFFDTSNIYGQGDSERLLAAVLGQRDDCIVCSKAGKYLSWKKQALVPFKRTLRGLARRSTTARQTVSAARAKPMPTRWDPPFLTASIEASLRRLGRPQIEMFMLHSPSPIDLKGGAAMDALEMAQKAGKLGLIGVSVDDVETAEAALRDPRVQTLQIPLLPGDSQFSTVAQKAHAAGIAVIAREILGGAQAIAGAADPALYAADRIAKMIAAPNVDVALVGMTKLSNLEASAKAARGANSKNPSVGRTNEMK